MIYTLDQHTPILMGDNFVADNATLIGRVTLEPGSSIWFNVVIRGDTDDIVIGEGSNIQDGSILHTDAGFKLRVGKNCTVGHMVMLHGCEIGDGSLIGIRAVILNGAKIGRNCLVGAGSLVTEGKSFPDNSVIMGTPAKVVRELSPKDLAMLRHPTEFYQENGRRYKRSAVRSSQA